MAHADHNRQLARAWLLLSAALGVHVTDEALNGFLDVYNPTVQAMKAQVPWLPLPVFRFDVWLGGLILATVLLGFLSRYALRGARWIPPLGYAFAGLMLLNAIGHTAGTIMGRTVESVRFERPMPGFYSSPLLFAASLYLLLQLHRYRRYR